MRRAVVARSSTGEVQLPALYATPVDGFVRCAGAVTFIVSLGGSASIARDPCTEVMGSATTAYPVPCLKRNGRSSNSRDRSRSSSLWGTASVEGAESTGATLTAAVTAVLMSCRNAQSQPTHRTTITNHTEHTAIAYTPNEPGESVNAKLAKTGVPTVVCLVLLRNAYWTSLRSPNG
jgi:hypothetical protein